MMSFRDRALACDRDLSHYLDFAVVYFIAATERCCTSSPSFKRSAEIAADAL